MLHGNELKLLMYLTLAGCHLDMNVRFGQNVKNVQNLSRCSKAAVDSAVLKANGKVVSYQSKICLRQLS